MGRHSFRVSWPALPAALLAALVLAACTAPGAASDPLPAPTPAPVISIQQARQAAAHPTLGVAGLPDPNSNSQAGRTGLVDVGGYRLFIACLGTGSPTLILESAQGSPTNAWGAIPFDLAAYTQVCLYERAGIGLSDPAPSAPRTVNDAVRDLQALLAGFDVSGPYVIVAHGYGGLIARQIAAAAPRQVVGLVLIDALHESAIDPESGLAPPAENLEQIDWAASAEQVRAARSALSIPLAVIMHGASGLMPDRTLAESAELRDVWAAQQRDLLTLSSNSWLTVAYTGEHFAPLYARELIGAEARRVVALARLQADPPGRAPIPKAN